MQEDTWEEILDSDKKWGRGGVKLLDIVIVNYRTPKLFRDCCRSIYRLIPEDIFNLIAVDNSPVDEAVGTYKIENRGYGQACNFGASLGSAPFILFLNADTEVTPRSNMPLMLKMLHHDPSIAVMGPKQVSPLGWIASAGCPPCNNSAGYQIRGWREQDHGQYEESQLDCKYVAGSVILTRRAVFEKIKFLETPLYYEESYLCYVARLLGFRVVYCGKSLFLHHWDSSPKDNQDMISGRPVAVRSHQQFVEALRKIGYPENDIPAFV